MQAISLTEAAKNRCLAIKNKQNDIIGLYIAVVKGGCAGMEYKIELVKSIPDNVEIEEQGNFKIFIAKDSILYLLGTEIDYEETKLHSGFVFNNPNQVAACGCGESVQLKPKL